MGRRKQVRPRRSGGIAVERQVPETELKEEDNDGDPKLGKFFNPEEPFYVEIDKSLMVSEEHHLDISEILLLNVNVNQEFVGCKLTEELFMDPNLFLRFKSINVNAHLGRMKLGHWPALSEKNTCLEFLMRSNVEGVLKNLVMLSGIIDGTGEGVTGLVHLCSLKYFALRPIFAVELSDSLLSVRIRVEILSNLFDQCESLLDNTRHPWKKSVVNVMTWLRPEVVTSETRYGCSSVDGDSFPTEQVRFEVSRFYEAIKPSKQAPMLEDELPDMVPELRPYQRRAAYWMVQREKAGDEVFNGNATTCAVSPLCVPICLIDTPRRIYYNPFSGNVSLDAKCSSAYVSGGILADEMGLGKTIELLACVLANQMPSSEVPVYLQTEKIPRKSFSRLKRERVECLCGAVAESFKYEGLWVQCDVCDAWQHADCVGYAPERRNRRSVDRDKWQIGNSSRKRKSRKKEIELVEMDGEFTCQTCTALIQATEPAVATGATLIVCPTPILSQWHSEILRHTKKGALKTCVYEGVRSTSFSDVPAVSIDDLLNADIVLTTYDVLKEDLPHDSERHEGDRRFMRFMKRYPVIPTLLTRVLWWRVCLDEAQMVEGSAAAATELALRLHAKNRWCITGTPIQRELDDLYGLLRFLQSSPFDVFRWWSDVISGPYERGDAAAIRFTHDFFKQLMWRSSKSHVWDELELPPQEECISWLSFSPVEQHFYRRQHETCVDDARMVLESFNKEKNSDVAKSDSSVQPFITASEAAKLFNSLLKLRQACCHPQVGSSGLRSWQKSPMTMEEILSMLIGKTKLEGEDALRKIVVALNGLAGIAMIKKDTSEAVSLYREALNLVEENADDFRLDPLLDIHIHHNLAEASSIFPEACDAVEMEKAHRNSPEELNSSAHIERLKTSCEDLKQKYLTVYNSKLSVARQEFRKLYEQVCDGFLKRKIQQATWWLDALHRIDEAEDLSRSLFQKIGEALSSGNLNNKRSRASAGSFGSITSLKYYIQTGLDALYESRSTLLDRLLELDETMENPTEADIVLVRYCRNCNSDSDGPVCTHCELDEVFRVYEARLFRLNKSNNGETVMSAEEAVNLQKKKSALNQFYWSLSRENDRIPDFSSSEDHKDDGKKRDAAEKVMTSKSPSDLEIMLTIIRNVSKGFFSGRETISTSRNHLDLLQVM
ncbi:chromatin remodeling complex subunit [Genlisea aurea]|uniref:Chromatin remodeling complex subunit n=1 Tax=Genlisea aurea TaxID=192259 RepID=S8E1A8_9LAMI|nr:chromatin remodeling complex subunit [Genlisea aurea]